MPAPPPNPSQVGGGGGGGGGGGAPPPPSPGGRGANVPPSAQIASSAAPHHGGGGGGGGGGGTMNLPPSSQQQQKPQPASSSSGPPPPGDPQQPPPPQPPPPPPQQQQQPQPRPSKPRGRTAQKSTHSRSYPRGVGLDFRKLAGLTLMSYIDHHGVSVRPEAPPSELAVAVARHFESMELDEETAVGGFLARLSSGSGGGPSLPASDPSPPSGSGGGGAGGGSATAAGSDGSNPAAVYARSTSHFDGSAPTPSVRKRQRSRNAARPGEQVAAKVTRTDENGSWILAAVQRFYADTETYDVQDEDDTSKLIRLPWNHVMRLSTGAEGCFGKGTGCMAIFPETTSFYRAVVSKQPVWKLTPGSTTPLVKELILKFEDDEDENGRTPHRRVPSRYVIPVPARYFFEDDDDVDLVPPSTSSVA